MVALLLLHLPTSAVLRVLDIFIFLSATPTTEVYTLSLHDALPISLMLWANPWLRNGCARMLIVPPLTSAEMIPWLMRSEEHTSEFQSHSELVCRLLLDKKNPGPIVKLMAGVSNRNALHTL